MAKTIEWPRPMRFIPIVPFHHEQVPEDPTSFLLRYQTLFDEGYLLDFDRRALAACYKDLGDLLDPVGAELVRIDILWVCERIDKHGLLH